MARPQHRRTCRLRGTISTLYCLDNHDQVGNRPFGERLAHLVELDVYRAVSALLLLLPYKPLLFMGQEWAATSPFLYFTDHDARLGDAVTAGRMTELGRLFPDLDLDRIPQPQDQRTFESSESSKLPWEEHQDPPHDGILRLYRDLLALRRALPALRIHTRDHFAAVALGADTIAVRREGAAPGDAVLAIVHWDGQRDVHLDQEFVTRAVVGYRWASVLDTEDQRYGGAGPTSPTLDREALRLGGPSACVLTLSPIP